MPRSAAVLVVVLAVAAGAVWARYGSLDPCVMARHELRAAAAAAYGRLATELAWPELAPQLTRDRGRCLRAWLRLVLADRDALLADAAQR